MNGTKVDLLIMDPQNDFCNPKGALFVKGADQDSVRLAAMIKRLASKWNDIHVTLDSHRIVDVAHPIFWKDEQGHHPPVFTQISAADVANGVFRPTNPENTERMIIYTRTLAANHNKYPLIIWPYHCLIGSWGHGIVPEVLDSLQKWEKDTFSIVDFVTKGNNIWTEHYSAVQADVPDPEDPGTQLNERLIRTLKNADIIAVAGQALSHCVANTIRDIARELGDDQVHKIVLIEDTTSPVTGFEQAGENFVKEMVLKGMQTARSDEFLG
ncbi:MAG: isochorismatase family protein [Bacteroidia bacterium]|nr:isochorismatase family protein [Bacteroidia bacterium]